VTQPDDLETHCVDDAGGRSAAERKRLSQRGYSDFEIGRMSGDERKAILSGADAANVSAEDLEQLLKDS
jgi:hypothetical protein